MFSLYFISTKRNSISKINFLSLKIGETIKWGWYGESYIKKKKLPNELFSEINMANRFHSDKQREKLYIYVYTPCWHRLSLDHWS